MSEANKRKHPRVPFESEVTVKRGLFQKTVIFSRDISVAGIGLSIDESLRLGDRVKLVITLPARSGDGGKKTVIQLGAVVRWIRTADDCMGLEFTDMKKSEMAELESYIQAHEKKSETNRGVDDESI